MLWMERTVRVCRKRRIFRKDGVEVRYRQGRRPVVYVQKIRRAADHAGDFKGAPGKESESKRIVAVCIRGGGTVDPVRAGRDPRAR